ncbi:hypothetical protein C5167_044992 [Papaver somniferum]|uniref:Uncharacterized protein n=1 Tax=Papaver somniferum TaxID=3469 RepID=A0A4Y7L9I9_PAPSO|nr:hypothetical protein C5167_044992 [Papaver somniferum]
MMRLVSCTTSNNLTCSDSNSAFVVSYLINSCGLSQDKAVTASKKLNFKTTSNPDSVLTLLKAYGFTELHISKLIPRHPAILSSKPDKTLKPKLDFFISKGLYDLDLADFITKEPRILNKRFSKGIFPPFDIIKSIVQSDENVIKIINRCPWILTACQLKRVMVNVERLRNEGVPQANISTYLIHQPRAYMENVNRFKEIVEKVKEMGFNHLQTSFLKAIDGLISISEANWRKKMDVYKRWGWSEDHFHSAFRRCPYCMKSSEKKITAVMNFLVNEMGYDSASIAQYPVVINCSLTERIIPRCSVSRILVSKGLIKKMISINVLSKMVDECFLEKFVMTYEQEVPELMKVDLVKLVQLQKRISSNMPAGAARLKYCSTAQWIPELVFRRVQLQEICVCRSKPVFFFF